MIKSVVIFIPHISQLNLVIIFVRKYKNSECHLPFSLNYRKKKKTHFSFSRSFSASWRIIPFVVHYQQSCCGKVSKFKSATLYNTFQRDIYHY